MVTGYLHPLYPESLSEWGTPRKLPRSGGWILERRIPESSYHDAMGCYPLFFCQDWPQLQADLEEIGDELVSLSLVTDPFGDYDEAYLQRCFRDEVIPFKKHYIVDLQFPVDKIGSSGHRKHARRALRIVQVQVCEDPTQFTETWSRLYGQLIERHKIEGIRAFSKAAFAKQLSIPGTTILQAVYQGEIVGAQLYFMQNDIVHCHLGASSPVGYDVGAIYALDRFSFEYLAGKTRWLDLGGGAGIASKGTDGLSQYKQGWSTATRTNFFCGRIFNQTKYSEIMEAKHLVATDYFPAYRKGEYN